MNVLAKLIELSISGAIGATLVSLLLWLLRSWIHERLTRSIKHEYDTQLEDLRASLKRDHEILTGSLNAQSNTNQFAQERRLKAVEQLWQAILEIRTSIQVCESVDSAGPDNIFDENQSDFPSSPLGAAQLFHAAKSTFERHDNINAHRPFIGEYLFALFEAYRTLPVEFAAAIGDGNRNEAHLWWQSSGVMDLAKEILSMEEFDEFSALQSEHLAWLLRKMEEKILAASDNVISGRNVGEETVLAARRICSLTWSQRRDTVW